MFSFSLAVDEDIVYVYDIAHVYKPFKGRVHIGLECCGCIREPKGHH